MDTSKQSELKIMEFRFSLPHSPKLLQTMRDEISVMEASAGQWVAGDSRGIGGRRLSDSDRPWPAAWINREEKTNKGVLLEDAVVTSGAFGGWR